MNSTSSCQSTSAIISREAMRRDSSRTPAQQPARPTRAAAAEKTANATISTAVTARPLTLCQRLKGGACSCGSGDIALPASAELERDHRPGRCQPEQHRHARVAQVAGERRLQRLPDEDVLRVADQRRRRADVRRARRAPAGTAAGRGLRRAQPSTSTGAIARQTMSLVSTALSSAREPDDQRQQARRRHLQRHQPPRHVRVEPRQPELRRHDHHREQQQQRRHVDARPRALDAAMRRPRRRRSRPAAPRPVRSSARPGISPSDHADVARARR